MPRQATGGTSAAGHYRLLFGTASIICIVLAVLMPLIFGLPLQVGVYTNWSQSNAHRVTVIVTTGDQSKLAPLYATAQMNAGTVISAGGFMVEQTSNPSGGNPLYIVYHDFQSTDSGIIYATQIYNQLQSAGLMWNVALTSSIIYQCLGCGSPDTVYPVTLDGKNASTMYGWGATGSMGASCATSNSGMQMTINISPSLIQENSQFGVTGMTGLPNCQITVCVTSSLASTSCDVAYLEPTAGDGSVNAQIMVYTSAIGTHEVYLLNAVTGAKSNMVQLTVNPAPSTATITWHVQNKVTNTAIPNANIQTDSVYNNVADITGTAIFTMTKGTHSVVVSASGYASVTQSYNIDGNAAYTVYLTPLSGGTTTPTVCPSNQYKNPNGNSPPCLCSATGNAPDANGNCPAATSTVSTSLTTVSGTVSTVTSGVVTITQVTTVSSVATVSGTVTTTTFVTTSTYVESTTSTQGGGGGVSQTLVMTITRVILGGMAVVFAVLAILLPTSQPTTPRGRRS